MSLKDLESELERHFYSHFGLTDEKQNKFRMIFYSFLRSAIQTAYNEGYNDGINKVPKNKEYAQG